MNTKLLMTVSAMMMLLTGVALTFLPEEIGTFVSSAPTTITEKVIFQILGALYFAFGMVNWTAKANLIGGIYGRPIAIGNFCHFAIGGLALIKAYSIDQQIPVLLLVIVYVFMGVSFGIVFFRHPLPEKAPQL